MKSLLQKKKWTYSGLNICGWLKAKRRGKNVIGRPASAVCAKPPAVVMIWRCKRTPTHRYETKDPDVGSQWVIYMEDSIVRIVSAACGAKVGIGNWKIERVVNGWEASHKFYRRDNPVCWNGWPRNSCSFREHKSWTKRIKEKRVAASSKSHGYIYHDKFH